MGTTYLRQHRLAAWCALTFGISWGGILLLIGPGAVPLDAEHLAELLGLGYLAMLAGPTVATMLISAWLDGRAGLRSLRTGMTRRRLGGHSWRIAVSAAPVTIVAVLALFSVFWPDYVPRLLVEPDPVALLTYVAVTAVLTGVFEEIGWTGFVAPILLERHGVIRTGLIVGLVMAAWNAPIVLVKELSLPTPGTLPLVTLLAVGLLTWQVAYRVLMVWAYHRTRSVLLAIAMQTSLVAAWTSLTPLTLTQPTLMVFYVVLTVVWGIAGWVIVRDGNATQRSPAAGALPG